MLLGAYLLGSVPSAYVVCRLLAGVDIRRVGDGNVGTKNTFESVGRAAGIVVGALDIGKGMLAVWLARHLAFSEALVRWAGVCVVLGHDFPLFLGFRGGQGMAATVGVLLVLFPCATLLALAVVAVVLVFTRRWNLSCCIGLGLLPILVALFGSAVRDALYPVLLLPVIGVRKLMMVLRVHHARV
jgi:glycerol-3-phosphate acyltransferase PlsY